MGILDKIIDVASGGLASTVVNAIEKYFPPDMSPEAKANIQLALQNVELQRAREFASAQNEAEKTLNDRIAMYEGTSTDLRSIPILGALMIFLRGSQRIVWGFATIILDYHVFSASWKLDDPIISNAFWIVNFLVLGFLFGERAVMNVMPFITNMMQAKRGNVLTTAGEK